MGVFYYIEFTVFITLIDNAVGSLKLSSNGYKNFIGDINDGSAYFYFANIDGSRISGSSVYDGWDDVGIY